MACSVLEALGYVHNCGIVHLDVKPSNILIDRSGRALLTDFGIARRFTLPSGTTPEVITGSALYLSPEQAAGRAVDGRSDIYSMGVVLFEMAAGFLPVIAASAEEMVQCKRATPDEFFIGTPSAASPFISASLERIILQATAARPQERYQECKPFLDDLRRLPHRRP
jgi:eukaryotic-like serine/threonine-protein kinase